jgi:hypothetical protein
LAWAILAAVIGDLSEVERRLTAALKADTPFVYFDTPDKRVCVSARKVTAVEAV